MEPGQERFAWRHWPEGSVVFDRRLGHTHALNHETAVVLQALLEPSAPAPVQMRQRLAACCGHLPDAELDARIHAARELLVARGLL